MRVSLSRSTDTVPVSEAAIGTDPGGRYVLGVDAAGVISHRPVELGDTVGRLRAISRGLSPRDRIVVRGWCGRA